MSAHHDHEGKSGNVVYYGAVDNASGTVVIMEIAALMDKAIQKGFGIIFKMCQLNKIKLTVL